MKYNHIDWSIEPMQKMFEAMEEELKQYSYKLKPDDLDKLTNCVIDNMMIYWRWKLSVGAKFINDKKKYELKKDL